MEQWQHYGFHCGGAYFGGYLLGGGGQRHLCGFYGGDHYGEPYPYCGGVFCFYLRRANGYAYGLGRGNLLVVRGRGNFCFYYG